MKTYRIRELILKEMDKNADHMNAYDYAIHIRTLKNLREFLRGSDTTAIVIITSKDLCLLLQDQKWTIANTSTDTKDEIIGFKYKTELTIADFNMFDICFR